MSSFTIFHSQVSYIFSSDGYYILLLCHYCTIQSGTFIITVTRIFSGCFGFIQHFQITKIDRRTVRRKANLEEPDKESQYSRKKAKNVPIL